MVIFRPLLVSATIGFDADGRKFILVDSEQPIPEQGIAVWHEALHMLGIENEHVVEDMARRLYAACPEIVDVLMGCRPQKEQV